MSGFIPGAGVMPIPGVLQLLGATDRGATDGPKGALDSTAKRDVIP